MKRIKCVYPNRKQKGQSLVEIALIMPILVILIAGVVETSNLLITKNRLETAARAAARFAAQGGNEVENIVINTVTQTLDLSPDVWNVWLINGTINDAGTGFTIWDADAPNDFDDATNPNTTPIYGEIAATQKYTDVVNIIGNDCVASPPTIDINDPDSNVCIREQMLANLRKSSDTALGGVEIVGVYILHDIDSILGLDSFTVLSDITSVQGFGFIRTNSQFAADATNGCDAVFPIVLDNGIRSLNEDTFLLPGHSFTYPTSPAPTYGQFPNNDPDKPILTASEGTVYRYSPGTDMAWARWNSGVEESNNTFANSMSWPGNSFDYQPRPGECCSTVGGFSDVVYGFAAVGNTTDLSMHIEDKVAVNSAGSMAGIEGILQGHIDGERTLRVMSVNSGGTTPQVLPGPNIPYFEISGFLIVRIHGYSLSNNWLLIEFVQWDTSCGQQ